MKTEAATIARMDVFVHRAGIARPVRTSFGVMTDRPAVLLRLTDQDGAEGWGEIWCNFPAVGAEHRARLAHSLLPGHVVGRAFPQPSQAFQELERRFHVLGLQTGEPGPLAQILAGLDIALWDLAARRAGVPLRRLLNAEAPNHVPVYASGILDVEAEELIPRARADGFTRFKIKVGFGPERDQACARRLPGLLRAGERVMLDANQKWTLEEALAAARLFARIDPLWLEEPMPVDAPEEAWRVLSEETDIALAGGENIAGFVQFARVLDGGWLDVVQPDACKWGGISGAFAIGQATRQAGLIYCPHFLGAGVGLAASAEILAAVGGPGLLEVDVNPNPLRVLPGMPALRIAGGDLVLSEEPGLGFGPDLAALAPFQVLHLEASA